MSNKIIEREVQFQQETGSFQIVFRFKPWLPHALNLADSSLSGRQEAYFSPTEIDFFDYLVYTIIVMTGPNILTLIRILAIPILVIALLTDFQGHRQVAFVIFILAVLTDMLDGYWARRKNKKSSLGELLDPTADKLIITAALICLVELDQVPAWMAIVIIGREIAVTAFRAMASSRGIAMPASVLGKIKMNAEAITIALLILGKAILQKFYLLAEIGLWIVLATALFSAAEYYWRLGPRVLRENKD